MEDRMAAPILPCKIILRDSIKVKSTNSDFLSEKIPLHQMSDTYTHTHLSPRLLATQNLPSILHALEKPAAAIPFPQSEEQLR